MQYKPSMRESDEYLQQQLDRHPADGCLGDCGQSRLLLELQAYRAIGGVEELEAKDVEIDHILAETQVYQIGVNAGADSIRQLKEAIKAKDMEIERVQRERDAAVEDMGYMAGKIRDMPAGHDADCCFACKHDGAVTECPGYEDDDCFEWRGERSGD